MQNSPMLWNNHLTSRLYRNHDSRIKWVVWKTSNHILRSKAPVPPISPLMELVNDGCKRAITISLGIIPRWRKHRPGSSVFRTEVSFDVFSSTPSRSLGCQQLPKFTHEWNSLNTPRHQPESERSLPTINFQKVCQFSWVKAFLHRIHCCQRGNRWRAAGVKLIMVPYLAMFRQDLQLSSVKAGKGISKLVAHVILRPLWFYNSMILRD